MVEEYLPAHIYQPSDAEAVAVAQSLCSQAAQQQFKAALDQVTKSMNSIKNDFDVVKAGLPSVSGTRSLQDDWDKMSRRYSNICWGTKDLATEIRTFVEQLGTVYVHSIANASEGTGEEVVRSLALFQSDKEPLGQRTLQKVNDFKELKSSLCEFQKKYDDLYNTSGTQQAAKVATLTSKIRTLYENSDSINAQIQSLVMRQYSSFFKRNKWVFAVPGVGGVALVVDIILDSHLKAQIETLKCEYEQVSSKIRAKEVELGNASSNSATITKLKVVIDTIADRWFKDVISGLDIFHQVWAAGNEDVKELQGYQERGRQGAVPLSLIIYNQAQTSVYGGVISGLRCFSVGVTG